MKKLYTNPEITIVQIKNSDVITVSVVGASSDGTTGIYNAAGKISWSNLE